MGFKGKAGSGGGDYELPPSGNQAGVLIGIIDLGTHWESYKGGPDKQQRKILFVWEIEAEVEGKDERFIVGRDYNVTFKDGAFIYGEKANVRKMLESWKGAKYNPNEDVDPTDFLSKGCFINIGHKKTSSGKDVYEIAGVSPLPKKMAAPKPSKEQILYSADDDADLPTFDWLPRVFGEEVKTILGRSLEWKGSGRRQSGNKQEEPADVATV